MEFYSFVRTFLWIIFLAVVSAIAYCFYWFLWMPLKKRRHFFKYPQVYVNPKFHPLFGDFVEMQRDYENQDRFIAHYFRDKAVEGKPYLYFNSGRFDQLWINDPKLFNEFSQLVPSQVDRQAIDNSGFGRIGGTGGVS